MLPGLNPMFALEFTGPGTKSLRFVTPDEDVTLEFHCHVPSHEQFGMFGRLIVGKGGEGASAVSTKKPGAAKMRFEGVGLVIAVEPRQSRVILNHEEIKDFMAPMVEMSFMVTPATLLQGLKPGDNVRFSIDAERRMIVDIAPVGER